MVAFTSRARLLKPAETGEIVDISQFNANMDKIDENLGVVLCTSTTRPTNPFPGMLIRETDTSRSFTRDDTNTDWIPQVAIGFDYAQTPGHTGTISGTTDNYTAIHRFYLGPENPDAPDLLIDGIFYLQYDPSAVNDGVIFVVILSNHTGNVYNSETDTLLTYVLDRASTANNIYSAVPFKVRVDQDSAVYGGDKRYLKLAVQRTSASGTIAWVNGTGLSFSMTVQPITKNNDIVTVVPGYVKEI